MRLNLHLSTDFSPSKSTCMQYPTTHACEVQIQHMQLDRNSEHVQPKQVIDVDYMLYSSS